MSCRKAVLDASSVESTENMRIMGYFLLLLATAALAWDANIILAGYGMTGLSGILQIWQTVDRTSLDLLEQAVVSNVGYDFWHLVAAPFMKVPAVALFGGSGLIVLRRQNHEIKLRAPSAMEVEMMRQGLDPRRMRRRR